MFAHRYFASRYFAPRYWPKVGDTGSGGEPTIVARPHAGFRRRRRD